jgi:hypothetical protein
MLMMVMIGKKDCLMKRNNNSIMQYMNYGMLEKWHQNNYIF